MDIDDGIPLPERPCNGGRKAKYPFDQMTVGQSFFVPADAARKGSVQGAAHTANKRFAGSRVFSTRSVTENGAAGVRVWRVS